MNSRNPVNLKIFIGIAIFAIILFNGTAVRADDIYSGPVGKGRCLGTLEANYRWETLSVRFFHPGYKPCEVTKEELDLFLREACAKLSQKEPSVTFKSLFIGRIIEYPWIGKYLAVSAAGHPNWSSLKGQPLNGTVHGLVNDLLFDEKVTGPFREGLRLAGYKIAGVSVEKILVTTGRSGAEPPWSREMGKVPFDAMAWFTLEKLPVPKDKVQ